MKTDGLTNDGMNTGTPDLSQLLTFFGAFGRMAAAAESIATNLGRVADTLDAAYRDAYPAPPAAASNTCEGDAQPDSNGSSSWDGEDPLPPTSAPADNTGHRFLQWVADGVGSDQLPPGKTAGSLVYVVKEGLLLVSPMIFKVFDGQNWEHVQECFTQLGLHEKTPDNGNIWLYNMQMQDMRGQQRHEVVRGFLLPNPLNPWWFSDLPAPNEALSLPDTDYPSPSAATAPPRVFREKSTTSAPDTDPPSLQATQNITAQELAKANGRGTNKTDITGWHLAAWLSNRLSSGELSMNTPTSRVFILPDKRLIMEYLDVFNIPAADPVNKLAGITGFSPGRKAKRFLSCGLHNIDPFTSRKKWLFHLSHCDSARTVFTRKSLCMVVDQADVKLAIPDEIVTHALSVLSEQQSRNNLKVHRNEPETVAVYPLPENGAQEFVNWVQRRISWLMANNKMLTNIKRTGLQLTGDGILLARRHLFSAFIAQKHPLVARMDERVLVAQFIRLGLHTPVAGLDSCTYTVRPGKPPFDAFLVTKEKLNLPQLPSLAGYPVPILRMPTQAKAEPDQQEQPPIQGNTEATVTAAPDAIPDVTPEPDGLMPEVVTAEAVAVVEMPESGDGADAGDTDGWMDGFSPWLRQKLLDNQRPADVVMTKEGLLVGNKAFSAYCREQGQSGNFWLRIKDSLVAKHWHPHTTLSIYRVKGASVHGLCLHQPGKVLKLPQSSLPQDGGYITAAEFKQRAKAAASVARAAATKQQAQAAAANTSHKNKPKPKKSGNKI